MPNHTGWAGATSGAILPARESECVSTAYEAQALELAEARREIRELTERLIRAIEQRDIAWHVAAYLRHCLAELARRLRDVADDAARGRQASESTLMALSRAGENAAHLSPSEAARRGVEIGGGK